MNKNSEQKGHFTLPGEAGYEGLTLELAKKWGADVIRDSDGTQLSDEIVSSDYDIYSTLCLVRSDNAWAKANLDKLQQNFLMSFPVTAEDTTVRIDLLKGYFKEQFLLNTRDDPKEWWQVFDRTTGEEVPSSAWTLDPADGVVVVRDAKKWHSYTVNFLVSRIWEEISMYNHITNNWGDREHLMAVEPRYPETQARILAFLEDWLKNHPKTNVVRFTSLFYNFCWFWGDDPNLRFIYSDWASYDFTVNPLALREFEKTRGYRPRSEDFVNKGLYNSTHNVPTRRYRDWIDFTNEFVVDFGSKCLDLVHKYCKKAYLFYDDHWIGAEPYGDRFKLFNFDGIIKCVFNAFEARLCANVEGARTHELRLHPYLFPTGLGGEPTFKAGGNPKLDAQRFWVRIRRALLRQGIDRIGLGGYLHLVQDFPDFVDYIAEVADEFRMLRQLHAEGKPYTLRCKVAILTAWGRLRSWSCSGHMHEHPELELIRVIEALAGLPVDVEFLGLDDIAAKGVPPDVNVVINAGRLDSAWCGGDRWDNPAVIERLTAWVSAGGGFVGIGEPSASRNGSGFFKMSHVLGVDREVGLSICKTKYAYKKQGGGHFILQDQEGRIDFDDDIDGVFVIDGSTQVLVDENGSPRITTRGFHEGRAVYLSGYKFSPHNVRLLSRVLCHAAGMEGQLGPWTTGNVNTECAWFPKGRKLVVINNGGRAEETTVFDSERDPTHLTLAPYGVKVLEL